MSEVNEVAVVEETTAISHMNQFDIVDVEAAKAFMDNYQELVEALLDKKTDYQGGKKKKSAWRKLATAFNISDEPITKEIVRDENHQIISAYFEVKAVLPNGRSGFGVGDCSIFDKLKASDATMPSNFVLRKRFTNAEHDVIATAHTRAKSRAIADLIGAGEVSAEELGEDVKVSRQSRNNSNDTSEEPKPQRRTRRRAAPKENDEEVIDTKVVAEVVKNPDTDFESIDDERIQKAIKTLKSEDRTITADGIVEELFNLFNIGDLTVDEYQDACRLVKPE